MTGIVVTFVSIGILISSWRKMTNGERLLGVAQTTAQGVQMGAQMANAINAWVGPGAEGSSQAAANARIAAQATMVGAGAGIAAGVISMGIELSAAIKTGSVGKRYYEMRKKVPAFNRQIELAKTNQYGTAHLGMLHNLTNTKVKGEDYNPSEVDIVWLLWKVTKKMKRRKWRAEVGLTGAAASTASNGFALGTTIAAAAGTAAAAALRGLPAAGGGRAAALHTLRCRPAARPRRQIQPAPAQAAARDCRPVRRRAAAAAAARPTRPE